MSLINQMLIDLDEQQDVQSRVATDLPAGITKVSIVENWRLLVGGLVLMLGLVGTLATLGLRTPVDQGVTFFMENRQFQAPAIILPVKHSTQQNSGYAPVVAAPQPSVGPQRLVKRIELPPEETFRKKQQSVLTDVKKYAVSEPTTTDLVATAIPVKEAMAAFQVQPKILTKKTLLEPAKVRSVVTAADLEVSPGSDLKSADHQSQSTDAAADKAQPMAVPVTQTIKQMVKDPELSPGQRLLHRSTDYLQQGRLAEAETELRKAVELMPKNINVQVQLASLLMRGGRNQEAAEIVERGLDESPHHPLLVLLKARLLADAGDTKQATVLLEQTSPSGTVTKEKLGLLATLYQTQGQHRKAQAAYRRLLALDPHAARGWAGLAISSDVLGEADIALKAYQQAVTMQPLASAVQQYARERIGVLELERQVDGSNR